MGELFRRFWMPVALSEELPGPDCVPVKLTILGEDLIAFRDTDGKRRPRRRLLPAPRRADVLRRNEEAGLRCVYHGWKFDVDGQCTDMPNTPEGDTFRQQDPDHGVPLPSRPAAWSSPTWARRTSSRRSPSSTATNAARRRTSTSRSSSLECNWLQATEGDFDPSHGLFLHSTLDNNRGNPGRCFSRAAPTSHRPAEPQPPRQARARGRALPVRRRHAARQDGRHPLARLSIEDVDGAMYSASRPARADGQKVAAVSLTLHHAGRTARPASRARTTTRSNMRIPIDNTHMMFFRLRWGLKPDDPATTSLSTSRAATPTRR